LTCALQCPDHPNRINDPDRPRCPGKPVPRPLTVTPIAGPHQHTRQIGRKKSPIGQGVTSALDSLNNKASATPVAVVTPA
jgi:hypothetical protein